MFNKKLIAKVKDLEKRCEGLQYQINEQAKRTQRLLEESVYGPLERDGVYFGAFPIRSEALRKEIQLIMDHLGVEVVTTPEKTEIKKKS